MPPLKQARLVADAIAVCCPNCDAEQPDPDTGSDMWLPDQIAKHQGRRDCVSCDEPFQLALQGKAAIEVTPAAAAAPSPD